MVKLGILLFLAIIAYVYAAVARFPYEPKPEEFKDEPGCWLSELQMVLPYNIPYYPKDGKSCLQYTCQTNNETELFSCGVVGLPPNCHLEHDYTLDYPDCCKGTEVCDTTTEDAITSTTTTEATCITVT